MPPTPEPPAERLIRLAGLSMDATERGAFTYQLDCLLDEVRRDAVAEARRVAAELKAGGFLGMADGAYRVARALAGVKRCDGGTDTTSRGATG